MIKELSWDTKFFGTKIGSVVRIPRSAALVASLLSAARRQGYSYLTCRTVLGNVSGIQNLEKNGFYLTDAGIMWEKKAGGSAKPYPGIRAAERGDERMLARLSRGLFKNGRFYHDPFFSRADADRLYSAWIQNLLTDRHAKIFVEEGKGFIACKKISRVTGDIPLVGVIPEEQGKGIGEKLVAAAVAWFGECGRRTVVVRTQASNTAAMNFYKSLGFGVKYADVTMAVILEGRTARR